MYTQILFICSDFFGEINFIHELLLSYQHHLLLIRFVI